MYQNLIHLHPLTFLSLLFLIILSYYHHYLKKQHSQHPKQNCKNYNISSKNTPSIIPNPNIMHAAVEDKTFSEKNFQENQITNNMKRKDNQTFQLNYHSLHYENNYSPNLGYSEPYYTNSKSYDENLRSCNFFGQENRNHFEYQHRSKTLIIDARKDCLSQGHNSYHSIEIENKPSIRTSILKSERSLYESMQNFDSKTSNQINVPFSQNLIYDNSNPRFFLKETKEPQICICLRGSDEESLFKRFSLKNTGITTEKSQERGLFDLPPKLRIQKTKEKLSQSEGLVDAEPLIQDEHDRNHFIQSKKEMLSEEDKFTDNSENNKKRKRKSLNDFPSTEMEKTKAAKLNPEEYVIYLNEDNEITFCAKNTIKDQSCLETPEQQKKVKIHIKRDRVLENIFENEGSEIKEEEIVLGKELESQIKPKNKEFCEKTKIQDKENMNDEELNCRTHKISERNLYDRFVGSRKKKSSSTQDKRIKNIHSKESERNIALLRKEDNSKASDQCKENISKLEQESHINKAKEVSLGKIKSKNYRGLFALDIHNKEIKSCQKNENTANQLEYSLPNSDIEESSVVTATFCNLDEFNLKSQENY